MSGYYPDAMDKIGGRIESDGNEHNRMSDSIRRNGRRGVREHEIDYGDLSSRGRSINNQRITNEQPTNNQRISEEYLKND